MDLLWRLGVRGRMWLQLHRCMTRQQLFVQVGHQRSDPIAAHRGTPEGAIDSPLLFAVYFDSFARALTAAATPASGCGVPVPVYDSDGVTRQRQLSNLLYADDVKGFAEDLPGLQRLLDAASREAHALRFRFNVSVTKTTVFVPPAETDTARVTMLTWSSAPDSSGVAVTTESRIFVLPAGSYRYLGEQQTPVTPASVLHRHDAHLDRVQRTSRYLYSHLCISGIINLPMPHCRTVVVTMYLPKVLYASAVWGFNIPAAVITDNRDLMRMYCRSSRLPIAALHAVTGFRRVELVAQQAAVQQCVAICSLPRHHPARTAVAAELARVDAGVYGPAKGQLAQQSWWIRLLELLTEMDTADRWYRNPSRAGSNAAPYAGTLVATGSMRKWGGWVHAFHRVLLHHDDQYGAVPLTVDDEAKIVTALKCRYRHSVAVVELRRHASEVEALRQGRDVHDLIMWPVAPPYTWTPPSAFNSLRHLCRGGLRCVMSHEEFANVGKLLRDGDAVPCYFCGTPHGGLRHLVRDCSHFAPALLECWQKVVAIATEHDVLGRDAAAATTASTPGSVPAALRDHLYHLIIGAPFPSSFLQFGFDDWYVRHHRCGHSLPSSGTGSSDSSDSGDSSNESGGSDSEGDANDVDADNGNAGPASSAGAKKRAFGRGSNSAVAHVYQRLLNVTGTFLAAVVMEYRATARFLVQLHAGDARHDHHNRVDSDDRTTPRTRNRIGRPRTTAAPGRRTESTPPRPRGRPRKTPITDDDTVGDVATPPRPRGRPRKRTTADADADTSTRHHRRRRRVDSTNSDSDNNSGSDSDSASPTAVAPATAQPARALRPRGARVSYYDVATTSDSDSSAWCRPSSSESSSGSTSADNHAGAHPRPTPPTADSTAVNSRLGRQVSRVLTHGARTAVEATAGSTADGDGLGRAHSSSAATRKRGRPTAVGTPRRQHNQLDNHQRRATRVVRNVTDDVSAVVRPSDSQPARATAHPPATAALARDSVPDSGRSPPQRGVTPRAVAARRVRASSARQTPPSSSTTPRAAPTSVTPRTLRTRRPSQYADMALAAFLLSDTSSDDDDVDDDGSVM